ncbi:MAG: transferrin-binding protein-like solute binding protein [Thiobacillus sp.]|nr:transferrin-binding protein-like solute binding protein [Thiobacillus sp.]
MKKTALFYACASLSILAGCGGGGGGTNIRDFTSWSAIEANTTVRINALTIEGSVTYDGEGLTSISSLPTATTDSTLTLRVNSDGDTTAMTIQTPSSTVSFSTANGDAIENVYDELIAAASPDFTKAALAADPYYLGWNYQTFGIWFTDDLAGHGTFGAMSVGAPTAGDAIPAAGTATYTGRSGGLYLDPSGTQYFTFADLSVAADFGARELAFATSNTETSQDLLTSDSAPALDLSGTLTYAAGSNSFTGTVANSGALSGTANGRFYGPAAEELGGVFALSSGTGFETYAGAFGGVRGAITPP